MSEPLPETRALSNEAPRKLDTEGKKKNRKKHIGNVIVTYKK